MTERIPKIGDKCIEGIGGDTRTNDQEASTAKVEDLVGLDTDRQEAAGVLMHVEPPAREDLNLPVNFFSLDTPRKGADTKNIKKWIEIMSSLKNKRNEYATMLESAMEKSGAITITLQTQMVIDGAINEIQLALRYLNKFTDPSDITNLEDLRNGIRDSMVASEILARRLGDVQREAGIGDKLGTNTGSELKISTPSERQIFLATKSEQIPNDKRIIVILKLAKEAEVAIGKWARGTQLITLADLMKLVVQLESIEKHLGIELESVRNIEEILKGLIDMEEGPTKEEIGEIERGFQEGERLEKFEITHGYFKRKLSDILERMKGAHTDHNAILLARITSKEVHRLMGDARGGITDTIGTSTLRQRVALSSIQTLRGKEESK